VRPATNHPVLILAAALTGLTCCTAAALAQPTAGAPSPAPGRAVAHEAYERNHWATAYAAFVRLADEGDADAARIALLMHRHGAALYGSAFEATPAQRQRWSALQRCDASCAGAVHVGEAGR
jgi:hypothetical protein